MSHNIKLKEIEFVGKKLLRPECVLCTKAGNVYVSDFRGGVTQITAKGQQIFYGGGEVLDYGKLKPNGIALLEDGSFLIAHLDDALGGIFRISRDNQISPFLTHIDNHHLPPCNFVYLDHQARLWITVSTKLTPRAKAYRSDVKDGFIIMVDEKGPRVVAEGIGYTNEVCVTKDGKQLYVNATFSRELIRYDISDKNALSSPEVITKFGYGVFPDGLTMDTEGFLWVTSIISNRLLRVNPHTGEFSTELEDVEPAHLEWVEQAYLRHSLGRPHLDNVDSEKLKNISSMAFSGNELSTIVLGCLLGDELARFSTNICGVEPAHWHFD